MAAYLAELHDAGRASSASKAVAATCFRAKLAGESTPAGERTARVLAGYRRILSAQMLDRVAGSRRRRRSLALRAGSPRTRDESGWRRS